MFLRFNGEIYITRLDRLCGLVFFMLGHCLISHLVWGKIAKFFCPLCGESLDMIFLW